MLENDRIPGSYETNLLLVTRHFLLFSQNAFVPFIVRLIHLFSPCGLKSDYSPSVTSRRQTIMSFFFRSSWAALFGKPYSPRGRNILPLGDTSCSRKPTRSLLLALFSAAVRKEASKILPPDLALSTNDRKRLAIIIPAHLCHPKGNRLSCRSSLLVTPVPSGTHVSQEVAPRRLSGKVRASGLRKKTMGGVRGVGEEREGEREAERRKRRRGREAGEE